MHARKFTAAIFVLEGINSFGTTLYFYYIYFFTEKQFGFTKLQNLLLAAALGLTYGISSIIAGRFAQRRGYFAGLKLGYAIMALMIGGGVFVSSLPIHLTIMFVGMMAMALTWPPLEALVSEGRSRHELQRNVGIYNLLWGGFGAVAYFCGGAIIEAGTFRALFAVSAAIHVLQFIAAVFLERAAAGGNFRAPSREMEQAAGGAMATACPAADAWQRRRSPVSPRTFLRMAWLANPFAYLAINTVLAVMPAVAQRLQLTLAQAGIFCSVWLFVRTGSFLALWLWPGWHYRFRWLAGAYLAVTAGFVAMLVGANLWMVMAAQVAFGLGLGLVYYSSLYYSMDVGDTKGEHGGFHEAMIGAGNFAGPALGALGQFYFPASPNSSTWTAAGLLLIGWAGLLWLRFNSRRR